MACRRVQPDADVLARKRFMNGILVYWPEETGTNRVSRGLLTRK
jgi:hypothetical protein